MTSNTHACIHEAEIIGQSRKIERLDTELGYKKERLDELKDYTKELKADNDRIEEKIDDIKDCVKDIINDQNNRLTALETTNRTLKWVIGLSVSALGVCIAGIALVLSHLL